MTNHNPAHPSRRHALQLGGITALGGAAVSLLDSPASADPGPRIHVTDLGPGVVQFSLMSGLLVGDTVYIGSRNLSPTQVIGIHLATQQVVAQTDIGPGSSIQALAADPTGRYLYAGILYDGDQDQPNLFQWDLDAPEVPARPVARIENMYIRALSVAPDGKVYAVGNNQSPLGLWEYDPLTDETVSLGVPDAAATISRAVVATESTVYYGCGTILNGSDGARGAALYAIDRSTGTTTEIQVPTEISETPELRDLGLFDDQLVIGTSGSTTPARFALMDLETQEITDVLDTNGTVMKKISSSVDRIYFTTDLGLNVYDSDTRSLSPVEYEGPDLGAVWGVDVYGDKVVVVSALGAVLEIDPAAQTARITDLSAAGAPGAAQLGMGITAGGGYAYVGGNSTIVRHDLRTGETVNLRAPGEAKDATVVNGVLYTGQYSGQGIWTYDPRTDDQPSQAADLAGFLNRPQNVDWDDVNDLLLVGVQSDAEGGGAFVTYDPATSQATTYVNPFGPDQLVRDVAALDGVAYLGGDNGNNVSTNGTISAWDPTAGRELWRVETGEGNGRRGVSALAGHGKHLICLLRNATMVVVDVTARRVVHTADLSAFYRDFTAMTVSRGLIYASSETTLFRINPRNFDVSTVVGDLAAGWYSAPRIGSDERGRLYTFRGRNLIQVDDRARR